MIIITIILHIIIIIVIVTITFNNNNNNHNNTAEGDEANGVFVFDSEQFLVDSPPTGGECSIYIYIYI